MAIKRGYDQRDTLARTKELTAKQKAKGKSDSSSAMQTLMQRQRANAATTQAITGQALARAQGAQNAMLSTVALGAGGAVSPSKLADLVRAAQGGGGGPVGKGIAGQFAKKLRTADSSQELWRKIARLRGGIYDIGGVHHDEGDYERDINVNRGKMRPAGEGMTSPQEQKWLRILARAMYQAFGQHSDVEIIAPGFGSYFGPGTRNKSNYPGHDAHEHISTPWF
jgi:hypothetical protein